MTTMRRALVVMAGFVAGVAWCDPARADASARDSQDRRDYSSGAYLYRTFCATCHGADGRGDGPTAPVLRAKPTDLTTLAKRHGGAFPRDRVLALVDGRRTPRAHGRADMPVWGDVFRSTEGDDEFAIRQRIEALAVHLASLQRP